LPRAFEAGEKLGKGRICHSEDLVKAALLSLPQNDTLEKASISECHPERSEGTSAKANSGFFIPLRSFRMTLFTQPLKLVAIEIERFK